MGTLFSALKFSKAEYIWRIEKNYFLFMAYREIYFSAYGI